MAGRYATALFDLAAEEGAIDQVASDMNEIGRMLGESDDLMRLVRSPVYSAEDQRRAFGAVLQKAGIGGITANFVNLAARNRRLFALPEMVRAFRAIVSRHRGEVSAEVVTAQELTEEQATSLAAALKEAVGRSVNLSRKVDASLIGGMVVRVGSRMIDTSLKTKLNGLRLAMKEVG
ncbi:ATP synthase delta chain [Lutibaculum baratangense AMV1]|uniref:ATP synthase subunit delta n=1 Tax=Lutibaculum baratangense AMV1 TaxID=631454 RepID=V4TKN0_9HYPH|nr:ATP synthase delta chain [Lutibaculum baratangense AMV1]